MRHDGSAAGEAVHWIPVQRSFGPVHLSRVGARHADGAIELLLDGDVSLGGITLALAGLALRTPLTTFRPEVDLAGLGLDVRHPGFELAGEFLRLGRGFAGGALLRTDAFSLSAVGAYEQLPNGQASLFVYAVLDYPLGGPAFFFVTGLAAGFGYNRAVVVPPVAKVTEFPLVKEASSGASAPPASGLTAKLQSFSDALPPSAGSVFGALGITFTSFKTVDSFALLVVSFGSRLRFDLLGSSTLIAPAVVPGAAPVPPVAEIHMGFHAQLVPEEGFLGLEAQLTAASYVLSDRCHLTGGAAFFSWLAGEHAGDFVVSVGGYHPHFHRPDHYPVVPRVGVDWHVTDELAIKGDLYYALTGHAIMAGGHLEASYTSPSVTASFAAGIDLLACWQPLRYEGLAYVHVAVHWGPFDFEVGADVHVWGPPFAGYADVDLHITTVRVHFGDVAAIEPTAATWADFAEAALPGEKLSITCSRGLVAEIGTRAWVVDPDELVLAVGSRVPLTRATVGETVVDAPGALRVAPMGAAAGPLDAPLTVTVGEVDLGLRATPVLRTGPAALWGAPRSRPDPADRSHVDTLAGLELRPPLRPPASETAPLLPERFEPQRGRREPGYTRLLAGTDLDELSAEDVRAKRERVFAALGIDPAELRPAAGTPATPRRIMVWPLWRDS